MKRTTLKRLFTLATAVSIIGGGYVGLQAGVYTDLPTVSMQAPQAPPAQPAAKPKTSKIYLNHADVLTYDQMLNPGMQRLIGNVKFTHGNATMTCDSAYLNEAMQSFEAFGQVHMIQADTVHIFARYLYYDGITRLAQLRHNVELRNTTTTILTDSLDYDRVADVAYYFEGGSVSDAQNTLTSDYGEFYPQTNDAEFRYNVRLVNDSTELTTEHLFYNTDTRIARFMGQTDMTSSSGSISSTRGVYDLNQDVGVLLDRSQIVSGSKTLIGDSIYYDGTARFGEAFGSMILQDTMQRATLYGDYGYFDDQRRYAFATSRAYAVDYSQTDTLYLGADTLELLSFPKLDSLMRPLPIDTAAQDSMHRQIRAYSGVKVYRRDVQAVADSLSYTSADSSLRLYRHPIMWSEQRQTQGDTIHFQFSGQKLDYVDVLGNTVSAEELPDRKDSYNQLSGATIRSWIQDSTVRRIEVKGDVESIFYMKDDGAKEYTGLNRLKSQTMTVDLDSGKLVKAHWQGEAHGKVYPLAMAQTTEVNRLPSFAWHSDRRPLSPQSVIQTADSTSRAYTLTDLKRFSGVQAELKAYQDFDTRLEKAKKEAAEREAREKEERKSRPKPSYQYVLRPKDDGTNSHTTQSYIDLSWLYNHSSSIEPQGGSNTNPSIGMPERKS